MKTSILKKSDFLKFSNEVVLFLFCFSVIFGPAFSTLNGYDFFESTVPDIESYLGLANFDFDQSPIRRYRVIVPFLAAAFNFMLEPIFSIIKPYDFSGNDFSLCMSFLLVNCCFFSLFGVLLYKLCFLFSSSKLGSIIGVLSILTCRWTGDLSGTPVVDSFYIFILVLLIYGIATRKDLLVIIAIFLGPWAKEAFIFVVPLIFFFTSINKIKQLALFTLSGVFVFSFRYYIDITYEFSIAEGLENNMSHIFRFSESLKRLFSFHGLYEILSITGIWSLLFLFLIKGKMRQFISKNTPLYFYVYIVIVIIHGLISTELARMFYLASPVLAVWISLIVEKKHQFLKDNKINIWNF